MSHEIRTPMNGVMVMAELLASEPLPPKALRHADTIVRSGRNLLSVINDILDFSKIEAGRMDVEISEVDVVDLIDEVVALFHDRARDKGLELVAFVHPDAPRLVPADTVRLGQVIANLVSNAVKFTERGRVTLKLLPDRHPDHWRLVVSDTGIGIVADKLDSVFGAFTQEDQTTTRRFGGTGLGLSIAKRLVEAMHGAIAVSSEQGKGTSFHVRLPRQADAPTAAPPRLRDAGGGRRGRNPQTASTPQGRRRARHAGLPLLSPIAHRRPDRASVACTFRGVTAATGVFGVLLTSFRPKHLLNRQD